MFLFELTESEYERIELIVRYDTSKGETKTMIQQYHRPPTPPLEEPDPFMLRPPGGGGGDDEPF